MPAWALKLAALSVTLLVLLGSFGYARDNVKNPNAPLQPPVADKPAASGTPNVAPTIGPLLTARPGQRAPATTPGPRLTLAPGVQTASLAPITFTHTS